MKINKMTASFGKLENESIAFHDGLNVVCAPNESGKSTWCAFIKSMLYGVDSSERAKIGYLPDKMRYAPWSGAPSSAAARSASSITASTATPWITNRRSASPPPTQTARPVPDGAGVNKT